MAGPLLAAPATAAPASTGASSLAGTQLLVNPGFEAGRVGWRIPNGSFLEPVTMNRTKPARTGYWKMWLGGEGYANTETVDQTVAIPVTAGPATLSYWVRTDTYQYYGSRHHDSMRVQVIADGVPTTLKTISNLDATASYLHYSHDLSAYKGKTVTIRFTSTEDRSYQTSFVVDDTALTVY